MKDLIVISQTNTMFASQYFVPALTVYLKAHATDCNTAVTSVRQVLSLSSFMENSHVLNMSAIVKCILSLIPLL